MKKNVVIFLLMACSGGMDSGLDNTAQEEQLQRMTQATKRWRNLKISQTAFVPFGQLQDDTFRVHASSFIGQLDPSGAMSVQTVRH